MDSKFKYNITFMILTSLIGIKEGIRCRSECYETTEYIEMEGKYMTCEVEYNESFAKAENQEKTAAKLYSANASWYIYKKKPALNLTWTQKEQDIFNDQTKGCHVTISWTNIAMFYNARYKISDDKPAENAIVHAAKRRHMFVYDCFGTTMQTILPGDEYGVKFESIPTAKSDETINKIKLKISLPKRLPPGVILCTSKSSAENKKKYRKLLKKLASIKAPAPEPTTSDSITNLTEPSKVNEEQKSKLAQDTLPLVMVIMSIVFLLIAIIFIIVLCKSKKKAIKIKPTLVVTDIEKHQQDQMESIYRLVETLRHQGEIVCNWENQETISRNSLQWYTEQMAKAENIVFVAIYNSFDIERFLRTTENDDGIINEFERAFNYLQNNWKNVTKNCVLLVTSKPKKQPKNFSVQQFKQQYSNTDTFLKQCLKTEKSKTQAKSYNSNREDQKLREEISVTSSDDTNITVINSNNNISINEEKQAFITSSNNTGARPKHSNRSYSHERTSYFTIERSSDNIKRKSVVTEI